MPNQIKKTTCYNNHHIVGVKEQTTIYCDFFLINVLETRVIPQESENRGQITDDVTKVMDSTVAKLDLRQVYRKMTSNLRSVIAATNHRFLESQNK